MQTPLHHTERKSTRKSVKYKLDEDGNKIPRSSTSDSERKLRKSSSSSKHRRSSKSKGSTDREKKIALHAKARREAERQRKKGELCYCCWCLYCSFVVSIYSVGWGDGWE